MRILGLSGKAGSGKTYISDRILQPLGWYQWALAYPMKTAVVGQGRATFEEVFVTKPPHVRTILQLAGTEEGRYIYGEDVWLKTTFAWLKLLSDQWMIYDFVISDIRFKNEVEYIQKNGGKVIRILAQDRVDASSLSDNAKRHVSETELDEYPFEYFDGVISNAVRDEASLPRRMGKLLSELHLD